jgi:hypothetical protein
MRDTIDMAREALVVPYIVGPTNAEYLERLKAFEALVRADQDEKYKWDIHSCGPTCKRYACVAMREAVEAERKAIYDLVMEAPFKEFDRQEEDFDGEAANAMKAMAFSLTAAIRNRGNI